VGGRDGGGGGEEEEEEEEEEEGYQVTVRTPMMGTGTVSQTLVSFNKMTRLSARDFTEFSRRESFKTQNKNLLA